MQGKMMSLQAWADAVNRSDPQLQPFFHIGHYTFEYAPPDKIVTYFRGQSVNAHFITSEGAVITHIFAALTNLGAKNALYPTGTKYEDIIGMMSNSLTE